MLSEAFCDRISDDWLWRESEMRDVDARLLKRHGDIDVKSAVLIVYSHWEGHFKECALELLDFIKEGISRKLFKWTDVRFEVRQRLLFCSYRRASLSGQTHETFISYLNALHETRHTNALSAKSEIVLIDDNLNTLRAEAICRNLGVETDWFILKRIIIDERLVENRNAIAHGSRRLRTGDLLDLSSVDLLSSLSDTRLLIREAINRFQNAITTRTFLDF